MCETFHRDYYIYVVCVVDMCVKENKEGYVQLKEESMCVFVYVMA